MKIDVRCRWILCALVWACFLIPGRVQAQSFEGEERGLGPEIGVAIGAAFPQGNFTRNVNTGLTGYLRFSFPIKPSSGLSLMALGSGVDFKTEEAGVVVDTSGGGRSSISQETDFRSAGAMFGLQWSGSWEKSVFRPRLGISGGALFIESASQVRVDGALVDSLRQTEEQTRFGLLAQLASDWVLQNNIALTFEFQLNQMFNVAQFTVVEETGAVTSESRNVAYVSFLIGLAIPL
jgi:hypothetical protein